MLTEEVSEAVEFLRPAVETVYVKLTNNVYAGEAFDKDLLNTIEYAISVLKRLVASLEAEAKKHKVKSTVDRVVGELGITIRTPITALEWMEHARVYVLDLEKFPSAYQSDPRDAVKNAYLDVKALLRIMIGMRGFVSFTIRRKIEEV